MSSFQELVGLAKSKKLLTQKPDPSADMKALKRRIYARLEERFHQHEVDQLRVSQSEQRVLHLLSRNMLRLQMQGRRQGQLEGFSLADSHNPKIDLQSPNTVTAFRVKAHKKQRDLQDAKFNHVKAGLELESHKLLAVARLERSDLRRLARRDRSQATPSLFPHDLRLGLPMSRQKFKQKVRQLLRRALLRFACLGLESRDLDHLQALAKGFLACPDATSLFANLRQGRVKLCSQMLERNRWLAFDRDRVLQSLHHHLAKRGAHESLFDLLRFKGNLWLLDVAGRTAADLAVRTGSLACLRVASAHQLLLAAGFSPFDLKPSQLQSQLLSPELKDLLLRSMRVAAAHQNYCRFRSLPFAQQMATMRRPFPFYHELDLHVYKALHYSESQSGVRCLTSR